MIASRSLRYCFKNRNVFHRADNSLPDNFMLTGRDGVNGVGNISCQGPDIDGFGGKFGMTNGVTLIFTSGR